MAKIARKTQLAFGSSAGVNQIGQFGSYAAGSVAYTTDPAVIQALSNYLTGWFGAVVGGNSPAIEDMNALCFLFAYQLGYVLQQGVGEWDSGTTYYAGSIVQDAGGLGNLYVSLTNTNLNNALSSTTNWKSIGGSGQVISINPSIQSPYVMAAADNGKVFLVNTANAAQQFTLPPPAINFWFVVKDSAGSMGTNNITFVRNASENIEGLASSYVASASWGVFKFVSDGTNWFII